MHNLLRPRKKICKCITIFPLPVLQLLVVIIYFPDCLCLVPVDRPEVMLTIGVVVWCEGIEHSNNTNQAHYIGQCLHALRYHYLLCALAERVIQVSDLRGT